MGDIGGAASALPQSQSPDNRAEQSIVGCFSQRDGIGGVRDETGGIGSAAKHVRYGWFVVNYICGWIAAMVPRSFGRKRSPK